VLAGNGDLMLLPVHVPVLDPQHLALPRAGFERADETVVHLCTHVPMLGAVHLRARGQESLLLLESNSTISLRLLLHFDAHAESMERGRGQVRRILEAAPVDRRTQRRERAVHSRDLSPFAMNRFESQDVGRLFEHADWQIAEHFLDGLEPAVHRHRIAQALRLDVVREVQVEEAGNGKADRRFQDVRCHVRVTAHHDLREEQRLPHVLRVLFRRDRLGGAARQREVIDRHPPPPALMHHVEPPGVIAARTRPTAFLLARRGRLSNPS
jgi:hypothetical protein